MRADRARVPALSALLLATGALTGCSPGGPTQVSDPSGVATTTYAQTSAEEASPSAGPASDGPGPAPTGTRETADERHATGPPGEPDPAVVDQALTGAGPTQWRLSACSERLGITSADEARGRPLYLPCADDGPVEQSVVRIVDEELDVDEVVRLLLDAPTEEEAAAGFLPVGSPSVEFTTVVGPDDVLVLDVVGSQDARTLVEFSVGRAGLLANLMVDDYEDVALLVDGVPFCRNMGGC